MSHGHLLFLWFLFDRAWTGVLFAHSHIAGGSCHIGSRARFGKLRPSDILPHVNATLCFTEIQSASLWAAKWIR